MKDRPRTPSELVEPAPPVVAVGGILYRYNRSKQLEVLLIRKQGGFWTLPKGHIEANEGHIEAVLREMHEETGLSGAVEQMVASVSYIVIKRRVPRTKIVTYYLIRAQRGRVRPSRKEKIVRIKWFHHQEALRRIKRNRVRLILQQALELIPVFLPDEG